jgi:transposase, IS5 family
MKAHIGVDTDTGLVQPWLPPQPTKPTLKWPIGYFTVKEDAVHADAGYTGADERYAKKGLRWHIAAKRSKVDNIPVGKSKEQAAAARAHQGQLQSTS